MSIRAVRQWLYDRLVESATANPGTYPRNACAGVLYDAGQISGTTTTIFLNRPAHNLQAETTSAIIIDIPSDAEAQVTSGGLNATFRNDLIVKVSLLWAADFTGDPGALTPAAFTDEAVSARQFDKFVQGLRKTLRVLPYQLKSAGNYQGAAWAVTDPDDGFISRVQGSGGKMSMDMEPPMMSENATDIFYGVIFTFTLVETFLGTGL